MTKEKLKPCPFCGGRGQHKDGFSDGWSFDYVECFDCGARTNEFYGGSSKAIEAWNRRELEDKTK